MTESDKQLLEKNDPNGWTFKLTTIKDIQDEEDEDIPIWLGARQFYNLAEPKNAEAREPDEEPLRSIEVEADDLADAIC